MAHQALEEYDQAAANFDDVAKAVNSAELPTSQKAKVTQESQRLKSLNKKRQIAMSFTTSFSTQTQQETLIPNLHHEIQGASGWELE